MSKLAALILGPLLAAPVVAQDAPLLPDLEIPPVDLITPVPAPEIGIGQQVEGMQMMPENVDIKGIRRIHGNLLTGPIYWEGELVLQGDNGLEIFANSATWDKNAETITMEGDVSVYQGNLLQRGDRTVYYYTTQRIDMTGLKASVDPLLLEAGRFRVEEINGKQVYVGEDAGITTHDEEHPNFWVRASETRVYPEDRVTFRNLRLYAGDTPIFWLPYLSQPLDSDLGYHFVPGARSNWGPYLLNSYGIMLGGTRNEETGENEDAWLLSKWRFDVRGSRGIGTGVDLRDTRLERNDNLSGLSLYYLNDLNPDQERSGVRRGFVNEDRYRVELKQRQPLDFADDAAWYLDANLTWLSDRYYLEDFEPSLFRNNPFPDNTIGIFRRDDKSLFSAYGRLRVNDFYRADTRLPEIAYDQASGPLFGSPILHEGSTSLGFIGVETADFRRTSIIDPLLSLPPGSPNAGRLLNQLQGYERELAGRILALQAADPNDPRLEAYRAQLRDTSFTRLHTYQEISMPMLLGGWLSFVPQAGAGYTRYWSVDGPESTMDRALFHVGAETSLKFSKDYGAYQNHRWGIDGLLHVLQPYANWSYVSASELGETHPRVDRLTFTTRPRTLSPARYTAIDDLADWNTVRLGTRNRLITRRDGQSHEWLFLDTYMDAFLNDSEGDRNFSNLYNDVRWNLLPWMSVDFETQFPLLDGGSGFTEFASRVRFMPTENFEFSFGYRILDNHPVLIDSNRVDLRTYTRVSENWGIGTRHVIELDDATLESQQYTFHRDLGNWVAGVGLTQRDNRLREEYGIVFSITLKDFPSASLPFRIDAE